MSSPHMHLTVYTCCKDKTPQKSNLDTIEQLVVSRFILHSTYQHVGVHVMIQMIVWSDYTEIILIQLYM